MGSLTFLNALTPWQWGLALSVPVGITLLYFLRLKRRPLEVPSVFLWRKSIEDLRVNSLWQRLRRNLLLFLQLAAAAALLAALLRPAWNVTATGDRIVLLIDQSASMTATDGDPTRLDSAKQRAIDIVDQMDDADVAMVISFDDSARVVCSYTGVRSQLRSAIESIEPTNRQTDIHEALEIATAMTQPTADGGDDQPAPATMAAQLYLFSDGKFPPDEAVAMETLQLKFFQVGSTGDNVGILGLTVRPKHRHSDEQEVVARVRNFSASPRSVTAELRANGERSDLRGFDIPATSDVLMTFPAPDDPTARISLHLSPTDALACDDVAYAVTIPPEPIRILRIGPIDPGLDAALATPAVQEIATIDSLPASEVDKELSTDKRGYDLVIFDGCVPKVMPSANTWFVGAVPPEMATSVKEVQAPTIMTWDSAHPLLRFLNIDDVSIFQGSTINPDERWKSLIETDQGLLLAAMNRGIYTDLVLAAPLVDEAGRWETDWPLKPSFPLFVMNVLRTLGGVDLSRGSSVRTGEPIVYRPEGSPQKVQAKSPGGGPQPVQSTADGRVEVLDTDDFGFYQLDDGQQHRFVAVNLFDEAESDIAPSDSIQVGDESASDVSKEYRRRDELWKWLALAGLAVLAFEWYVYNRRVYI